MCHGRSIARDAFFFSLNVGVCLHMWSARSAGTQCWRGEIIFSYEQSGMDMCVCGGAYSL